ncbi:MAG: glycosyltransferase family 4 protein [Verrucomicrobia bacterium]|nr:glycosyltransferase family 4 protein [Verrucomicrobiota bacterium]
MKILMGMRRDAATIGGGDVVQMLKTGAALARQGVEVEYSYGDARQIGGQDAVHLFNTTRIDDTYEFARVANARRVPLLLSTIWHSMEEMGRAYGAIYGIRPFPIWTYTAVKETFYRWRSRREWRLAPAFRYRTRLRQVVGWADAVLPNSEAELRILKSETGCEPRAAFVVPNGFDIALGHRTPWAQRSQIVCAGRVEPRKNQLGVVRAFQGARLPAEAKLVLHGATMPQARAYGEKVRRAMAGGQASYGGLLSQEALYAVFGRSRVAVLASYFETTGLSALEGLAHGCSVVITDSPCTREYFGEAVEYCDPFSDASIAAAIERAWQRPPPDVTALLARNNWAEAGRITLQAYETVLRGRRSRQ